MYTRPTGLLEIEGLEHKLFEINIYMFSRDRRYTRHVQTRHNISQRAEGLASYNPENKSSFSRELNTFEQ